jgi:hypothetical protein
MTAPGGVQTAKDLLTNVSSRGSWPTSRPPPPYSCGLLHQTRQAKGWTVEEPEFASQYGHRVLDNVQTGSGDHPAYQVDTEGSFPRG